MKMFGRPDDDALVEFKSLHVVVAAVPDGEDVGRQFADFLAFVQLDLLDSVNGEDLVGVDCY